MRGVFSRTGPSSKVRTSLCTCVGHAVAHSSDSRLCSRWWDALLYGQTLTEKTIWPRDTLPRSSFSGPGFAYSRQTTESRFVSNAKWRRGPLTTFFSMFNFWGCCGVGTLRHIIGTRFSTFKGQSRRITSPYGSRHDAHIGARVNFTLFVLESKSALRDWEQCQW